MKPAFVAALVVATLVLGAAYSGGGRAGSQTADPEAIARAYLDTSRSQGLAGGSSDDLVLREVRESPGAYHVRFQQEIDGVPVFGANVNVSVSKATNQVGLAFDDSNPNATAAAAGPAMSAAQAIDLAEAAVGVTQARGDPTAEQVYYPVDRFTNRLAWQVTVPALEPLGDWAVIVAADNGDILLQQDALRFDTGRVFNPNPSQTSGGAIPPPTDCDTPANESALTGQYTNKMILGITPAQNKLKGMYVDLTAPGILGYKPAGVANEPSRNFIYNCNDDRFEEVMVYYWVDTAQRHLQSLGFKGSTGILEGPIPAHAHFNNECNAFYSVLVQGIHFGDGDAAGCPLDTDSGEDGDVIVHEYGHAIQDNQVPGWGIGAPLDAEEAGGIGEGFSDFLAAVVIGNSCVGEWFAFGLTECAGQSGLRTVVNSKVYPADFEACPDLPDGSEEVHCTGEVWAGALWALAVALGDDDDARDLALTLALAAHFYLNPLATFAQNASAIRQADIDLFGGAHTGTIDATFGARGINTMVATGDINHIFIRILHNYAGQLEVRLKVGSLISPSCNMLLVTPNSMNILPFILGWLNLSGTPCEPFLPPSPSTPWFLEVKDSFAGVTGTINDFIVVLDDRSLCVATDTPIVIPDGSSAGAASTVNCSTVIDGDSLDSDGDGCANIEELGADSSLGGMRDPTNFYDFYDITNSTLVVGARDKGVSGFDLSLLVSFGGTLDNGPPNSLGKDYDDDSNGNTIKDGLEIDYASIAGPASGPDGAITGFDLSAMVNQGGDSCTGPP